MTEEHAWMVPSPIVETLTAAADRLDQLAQSTSPAPWSPVQLYSDAWAVEDAEGWELAQESQDGDLTEPDTRWISTLGPQVAPALATWLRDRAEVVRRVTEGTRWSATTWTPSTFAAWIESNSHYAPAVTFARLVLDDEAPTTPTTGSTS